MCSSIDPPKPHIALSPPHSPECGCIAREGGGLPVHRTARLKDEILCKDVCSVNMLQFIYSSFPPRRLPTAPASAHLGFGARTACCSPRGLPSLTLRHRNIPGALLPRCE